MGWTFGTDGDDTIDAVRDMNSDIVSGAAGNDTLTGGYDADIFVFTENTGNDTITDFDKDCDVIDLSMLPEAIAFSELTFTAREDGAGTEITHDALGGSITVLWLAPADFTAEMFTLPDGGMTTSMQIHEYEFELAGLGTGPWEGSDGSRYMFGDEGATRILGNDGNNTIMAGEGDDTLVGGAGCNLLIGEEGDDILDGGAYIDILVGGAGADIFVFQAGHGYDDVHDFTDGEDRVDLSAFTSITAFSDFTILTSVNRSGPVIDLRSHGGDRVWLKGFDVSDLDAADFIFYEAPPDTQQQVVQEHTDGSTARVSLGTVSATDPEGAALSYSLEGGNGSGLFEIGAASGELFYTGTGEDYESGATSFELTVRASDGELSDPYLRGIYDEDGDFIANTRDDDGGLGRNSRETLTASEDGIITWPRGPTEATRAPTRYRWKRSWTAFNGGRHGQTSSRGRCARSGGCSEFSARDDALPGVRRD